MFSNFWTQPGEDIAFCMFALPGSDLLIKSSLLIKAIHVTPSYQRRHQPPHASPTACYLRSSTQKFARPGSSPQNKLLSNGNTCQAVIAPDASMRPADRNPARSPKPPDLSSAGKLQFTRNVRQSCSSELTMSCLPPIQNVKRVLPARAPALRDQSCLS